MRTDTKEAEPMTDDIQDRAALRALDEEIARIERDREAAELYGDVSDGPRIQRLLKRSLSLRQQRDALAARLGLPPRAGHPVA